MRSDEELKELGPLLTAGRLDELRSRMLQLWPADIDPDQQDIEMITLLLMVARQHHSTRAQSLYDPYAQMLKRHSDEMSWLQSFLKRAAVVRMYEGNAAATEWLRKLATLITPPNNGVANVSLANLLLEEGKPEEALKELRTALPLSISGFGWYKLEAIDAMIRCQLLLGNQQLAFEYAKTHAIESYKMGFVSARDLVNACKNHAHWLGQIDYSIDLNGNVARMNRTRGNHSAAAIAESEAALALARLDMAAEAANSLRAAAEDALRGSHPNDALFAETCRLLARFLDPEVLTKDELVEFLGSYNSDGSSPIISKVRECVVSDSVPDLELLTALTIECSRPGATSAEIMKSDILVHVVALIARYYEERYGPASPWADSTIKLYQLAIDCATAGRSAIALFVCRSLAEFLLSKGMPDDAYTWCVNYSRFSSRDISERFLIRQLIARSLIASDKQQAYEYALAALSDWQRILDGLYIETHKVTWLRLGEECLRCAIQAISEPVAGLNERMRRRELFRLMELGKARVVSDMINRREYIPRPYQLSQPSSSRLFRSGEEERDWNLPIMLQAPVYSDSMVTEFHDYDGSTTGIAVLNLEPLRCAVIRPMDPEARLMATAASLAFETSDLPPRRELYGDYLEMQEAARS